jgi:excisionase family DNA binding protein
MEGYITTTEAAERLKLSSARIRQLVASGKLPATKFGPVNMVRVRDLDLIRNRPSAGRPPKSPATPDKRATGQIRRTNGTSTGKKKGGKK